MIIGSYRQMVLFVMHTCALIGLFIIEGVVGV